MRLLSTTFVGALVVAISTAAMAQTRPDEPATGPTTAGKSSTAPGQTQSTPGQRQTTPGEASQMTPAQTGQTPSGQTTGNAQAAVSKATAADIKAGASVYDQKGAVVGKIDSVSSKGAVIDTGAVKATIPASSFAKSDKGLVIGMSKSQIDAAAKKSSQKPK